MRNSAIFVICLALACFSASGIKIDGKDVPYVTSVDLYGEEYHYPFTKSPYVRFTGIVTEQFHDESNPDYCFMTLADEYGSVYFSTRIDRFPFLATNDYVGCRVSVVGLNAGTLDKGKGTRQYLHRELRIAERGSFTVVEPPKGDPFDVPMLSPTRSVMPDKLASLGNQKLVGQVLAVRSPNEMLLLTPDDTVSRVSSRDVSLPRAGDFIEAVGPVETDTYFLNLSRARWRKAAPFKAAKPPPREMTAREIMTQKDGRLLIGTKLHGQTVKIRSVIRSIPDPEFGNRTIFAESDGITFPIDVSSCPDALEMLEPGSTVDVTGICWVDIDNWRPTAVFPQAKGFTLVVRKDGDMEVISRPSWWTARRLAIALSVALGLLAVILVWNKRLKALSEKRGRELAEEQVQRAMTELKVMERTRLSAELHDALSQTLSGIAMQLGAIKRFSVTDPARMAEHLDIASRTLKSCRDEMCYILWDLRSQVLDEPDIEASIRQIVEPHLDGTDVKIRFAVPRARLTDSTARALFCIIRELVVNAIRHGRATSVRIAGSMEDGRLMFSVLDNGRGFDPDSAPGADKGHFGLQGIRERMDALGGDFRIESAPGKGAKATVTMAVRREDTDKEDIT
jgi:signal transduction histidine kinase